jgi:DNA-binding MarR family transcriptional regulator
MPAELLAERFVGCFLRIKRTLNDEMCAQGLSMARTKLLSLLVSQGPARQAALAAQLGLAPRSVTDAIDGLEREGFAVRRDDPTDRRAKLVEATPAGIETATVAMATKHRLLEKIFGELDEESRDQLSVILDKIDNAAAALDTAPGCAEGARAS